ncbi:hypothetical protein [Frigoribacterium sp. CFBP 13707]|uniref:hypothetical protein n=1 Tax=Frigoribacterium sp. CFBP 13707 TaxID=2775313 RepID=UPI00177BE6F1|nr:hypothetical protein [Frigoribacterium sp. CFBP 13707]MBD8727576.1 hypothetical protein [Frigoribacterium sp. CFBP 13707]
MNVAGDLSKPRVTGDPTQVLALAVRWGATAELIWSAAESLRTLDAEGAQSDAIEAFLASAGEVEQQLRSVHGRYQGAGEALRAYAAALEEAQAASGPALREHGLAVDDHDAARRLVEKYEGMALVAVGEEARADYEELARVQRLRLAEAAERVVLHGGRVDAAHAAVEAAATTAIARLDDLEADGPRDSFWDDVSGAAGVAFDGFQQWMEDNDHWIDGLVTVAGFVGMALAVAALFIPGVNVFAFALMVGVLAVTTAQAAVGTGEWSDVAFAALSLATFGTGSVLVAGAKTAARGIAVNRVNGLVASGQSRSLATAWVKATWDRAAPGLLSKSLRQNLGDVDMAQIKTFLRRDRLGACFDDPVAVSRVVRDLKIAHALNASDYVVTVTRMVQPPGEAVPGKVRTR